ncbi:MAG: site-specific integrase [Firmicutes bacterium]|nr:site-specific integrase [Bacillota bacterium]
MNTRLYLRENGYYYVITNYRDAFGKRKQRWISTKTKDYKKALKVLERSKKDIILGHFQEGDNIIFSKFLIDWLETRVKVSCTVSTFEDYYNIINNQFIPFFGDKIKISTLRPIHIQRYIDDLLKRGVSDATVRKHYAIMSRAFKYALRMQYIGKNPASYIELPKHKKYKPLVYNQEELVKLLNASKDTLMETPIVLAIALGLRRGEVLGLRWENVDFKNKSVYICEIKVKVKGGEIIKEPKTEKSTRVLPLPSEITKYLYNLKQIQKENKKVFKEKFIDTDYVCTWPDGKPITLNYITTHIDNITKKAGLKKIRFHDLRHANATFLFKQGLSLKEIQVWLGHSVMSTTADIYTHLDDELKKRSSQAVSGLFKSF